MSDAFDDNTLRRVLRTLRVATGAALAEYDLQTQRGAGVRTTTFRALAASTGHWTFPEAGVTAEDGLLTATAVRSESGAVAGLVLQAQGSAGLEVYGGRTVRVVFGPAASLDGRFDRSGRLELRDLDGLPESDLSAFEIVFPDAG